MSDITICTNQDCGLIDFCWRFNAPPKLKNQSFQKFEPDYDKNKCEFFKPISGVPLRDLYEGESFP